MYETYSEFNSAKLICRECQVGLTYNKVVESDGCKESPTIMVIGEAPGADELIQGKPFVGKSGKLLRQAMNESGYNLDNTVITNIMPCRPQDNVFPKNFQIVKACVDKWLFQEISILRPRIILLVGSKAMKLILGLEGITQNRGKWFPFSIEGIGSFQCLPTYRPSYVLRTQYVDEGLEISEAFKMDIALAAQAAGFVPPKSIKTLQ